MMLPNPRPGVALTVGARGVLRDGPAAAEPPGRYAASAPFALPCDRRTFTLTPTPARVSMSTSVSMLNRSIFPRTRSLTRGCVTPSNLAAAVCVSLRRFSSRSISIIRSARILRLAASSGPKPRPRNTLPVDRCTRVRAMMSTPSQGWPSCAPGPAGRLAVVSSRHPYPLARRSGLLLEGVKDVDRLLEPRDIDHGVLRPCGFVSPEPPAHRRHRLPIRGIEALLDSVELVPCSPPGVLRKCPHISSCRPAQMTAFSTHSGLYKILYVHGESRSPRLQRPAAAHVVTCGSRLVLRFSPAAAEPPSRWAAGILARA